MNVFTNPLEFLEFALNCLNSLKGNECGELWCDLKMSFCRQFQNGLIFSTRFGADFFEETLNHLKSGKPLIPNKNEKLGEYDENFNKWLKKYHHAI